MDASEALLPLLLTRRCLKPPPRHPPALRFWTCSRQNFRHGRRPFLRMDALIYMVHLQFVIMQHVAAATFTAGSDHDRRSQHSSEPSALAC